MGQVKLRINALNIDVRVLVRALVKGGEVDELEDVLAVLFHDRRDTAQSYGHEDQEENESATMRDGHHREAEVENKKDREHDQHPDTDVIESFGTSR